MNSEKNPKVAIIGSGPSGLTAAIYTARGSLDTTVFAGNQPGGQLTTTTEIENFPGFIDGIMGPDLMENMQKQAERFGAKVIYSNVSNILINQNSESNNVAGNEENREFGLEFDGKVEYFDGIIIASGAKARYLGLADEEKWIGKGYHSCATCDGFFYKDKVIAVIGGGDSAMEEANFLTKFATKVYIIHRNNNFRASKIMLDRARNNPKIIFIENKTITKLMGEEIISSVELTDTVSGATENFNLDGIFMAIGHIPNSEFAKNTLDMDAAGYLLNQTHLPQESRNSKFDSSSKIGGIFVAGDIQDTKYRQAITAAGDGCKAALDLEKWLGEKETLV